MGGNFKAFSWDWNSGSPNGNKILLFSPWVSGRWNPLIRSEGCAQPLGNSWGEGMWRLELIRIPYTADAPQTSTSETQTCCFPLPKQHQGNNKLRRIFLSCPQGHLNSSSVSPTVLEINQFWSWNLYTRFSSSVSKWPRDFFKKSIIILSNSSYLLLELNWVLHLELLQNSTRRKIKKKKKLF